MGRFRPSRNSGKINTARWYSKEEANDGSRCEDLAAAPSLGHKQQEPTNHEKSAVEYHRFRQKGPCG